MTELPEDWNKFRRYSYPVFDLSDLSRQSIFSYYIAMENIKTDYLRMCLERDGISAHSIMRSMTY
jgi:hypothetical protein